MKDAWWFLVIAVVMVGAGAILAALPVPASRAPGAPVGAPPIGNPSLGTRPGNVGRGTPLISDEVEIAIEAELVRK